MYYPHRGCVRTTHPTHLVCLRHWTGAMSPKFVDGHYLKHYAPELLAGDERNIRHL